MKTLLLIFLTATAHGQAMRQNGNGSSSVAAGDITGGPVASSILPSTVAYTNKDNNWTAPQTSNSSGTMSGLKVISAADTGAYALDISSQNGTTKMLVVAGDGGVGMSGAPTSAVALTVTGEARISSRIRIPTGGIDINQSSGIGLGGRVLSWNGNGDGSGSDTGLSRLSAREIAFGNGTASNTTGRLVAADVTQLTALNCATGVTASSTGTLNGCVASDSALKTAVASMPYDAVKIDTLRAVTYEWKDKNRGVGTKGGFIAQEVEKVYPECVVPAGKGLKGVDANCISAHLALENQALRKRVLALEKRIP